MAELIMTKEYTKRRNVNRAYMKLDVWQRGMDLFRLGFQIAGQTRDWKLRLQFVDAVQSVSANIAEGYGRRTLPEYLQFLYVAKGSLGESLTRAIGLREAMLISKDDLESFDQLHYEVENKLLHLISAMESKTVAESWRTTLPIAEQSSSRQAVQQVVPAGTQKATHAVTRWQTVPSVQQSKNPAIHQSR